MMALIAQGSAPAALRPARPHRAAWILMFAAALALRVIYVLVSAGVHARPFSDPAEYDAVAWNLARGLGFSLASPSGSLYPSAVSPPLLPWIVSLLYAVVGHRYLAALLLQCVLAALAPLLLAALGGSLFDRRVGLVAGWLCVVHPVLVFFSAHLLTENLLVTTQLLALWLSVRWVERARAGRALGAGLAWGVASLARPTVLLLPVVVLGWAWGALRGRLAPVRRLGQAALLLLGLALAIGPWTLRNALVLHAFVPVATRGGGALWVGNNPQVWGDLLRRGGGAARSFYDYAEDEFRGLDEIQRDALARRRAVAFLRAHRDEWPAMALAKLARFWRVSAEGGGTGTWQRPGSPLTGVLRRVDPLLIWSLPIFPLALWGVIRLLCGPRRWFASLVLWVILYFNLLAAVFWGSLRMRMPIEPLIVLLAAVALVEIGRLTRRGARNEMGGA
jgi:4-amino-4-deoxy-L-arabinose transferase-like glycosyltransferase